MTTNKTIDEKHSVKSKKNILLASETWSRNFLAVALLSLGACNSSDKTSSEVNSDIVAIGPIAGLGSIVVNGLRFDDNTATVTDTNGTPTDATRLGIGMHVEVRGQYRDTQKPVASQINVISEIQGAVTNINVAVGSFTILEHNITTSAGTFFDGFSGISSLNTGDNVEVYGLKTGSNISADRIERKNPGAGDYLVKIRGSIDQLSVTDNTFKIGQLTVNFASAEVSPLGTNLANGLIVEVKSMQVPTEPTLQAAKIQAIPTIIGNLEYSGPIEIKGIISDFQSIASFKTNNFVVDGSTATFLRGSAQNLSNGSVVEAKGNYANGKLTASTIKFDDDAYAGFVEIFGTVDSFESLSSFIVRGVQVDASRSNVVFERGLASEVAAGRLLEVEGTMETSNEGTKIFATEVKFEDRSGGSGSGSGSGSGNGNGSGSGSGSESSSSEIEFTGNVTSVNGDVIIVGGRSVQVLPSTMFRKITRKQIVVGAYIEVKGTVSVDGSISATRIKLED